jgi:hypothetical protein
MSLTRDRPSLAVRAVVALTLALLIHLSAWQALAGIRVLLPRREPQPPVIDVTLLPAQTAVALPARRAVVRAGTSGRAVQGRVALALTAVRTAQPKRPGRHAATTPAREPQPKASRPGAREPAPAAFSGPPAPEATAHASPAQTPDNVVATASPTAPGEPPPSVQPPAPTPSTAAAPAAAPSTAAPSTAAPAMPAPAMPAEPTTPPAPLPSPASGETPATPAEGAPAAPPSAPAAPQLAQPTSPAPSPHPPVQVVLPKSARFVYDSYGTVRVGGFMLGVRGRTTTRWRFKDGRYQSDLSIDVVNFAETSQGHFDPDFGLEPERYSETRPHRPVSTTQFDWPNHRVSFTEDTRQGEAEPGTQDRLSVQFQLSVLRQVYPERFVRGGVMPITLAGTHDVSHWTFTVTGEDLVDSGLGHLPALRVLSNRTTASGDESLEVWISEKLNWFPVRIRIVDKNRNVIDSVLDEATID